LGFEFGFGEDAGVSELAELLELAEFVVGAGWGWRGGGFLVLGFFGWWGLFGGLFLFLGGPASFLAVSDTSGDAGGGAGDHCCAGDSTEQTWHGTH
jgi:hypothetical protein